MDTFNERFDLTSILDKELGMDDLQELVCFLIDTGSVDMEQLNENLLLKNIKKKLLKYRTFRLQNAKAHLKN